MSAESNVIEVDPNADNSGSDYETGSSYLSTDSVTASIYAYRYENGRRYHAYKDGKYSLPNDEKEQDRLDIVHHIYLLMMGDKLHLAPIGENPQKILDIGTGTGIWAIDMAERYQSAEVIGTDLSPIQPTWVPPNVKFQIDDAEGDWTWGKDLFDFIHIRHLSGAINDWKHLLEQAFKFTKPGGYVEVAEYDMGLYSDDGTYHEGLSLWKFYDLINKASRKSGREFQAIEKIKEILVGCGFEDITYQPFKVPMGTWPANPKQKELGAYALLSSGSAYNAFGMALFTRVLGMDADEAQEIVTGCENEVRNRKIHTYSKQHIWWARKPEVS